MDKVLALFGLELTHAHSVPSQYFFKRIDGRWYLSYLGSDEWNEVSHEDACLFLDSEHTSRNPYIIVKRSKIVRKSRIRDLL